MIKSMLFILVGAIIGIGVHKASIVNDCARVGFTQAYGTTFACEPTTSPAMARK